MFGLAPLASDWRLFSSTSCCRSALYQASLGGCRWNSALQARKWSSPHTNLPALRLLLPRASRHPPLSPLPTPSAAHFFSFAAKSPMPQLCPPPFHPLWQSDSSQAAGGCRRPRRGAGLCLLLAAGLGRCLHHRRPSGVAGGGDAPHPGCHRWMTGRQFGMPAGRDGTAALALRDAGADCSACLKAVSL